MVGEGEHPPAPADPAPVEFAPRLTSRILAAASRTVPVLLVLALPLTGPTPLWLTAVAVVALLPLAVLRWLLVRAALRQPYALRVEATGVRWSEHGTVLAWADVARIEVRVARGLRRLLPHLDQVVLITPAALDFARRAGTVPDGWGVWLARVRATPDELVAAFRRFTDAPAALRLR